MKTLVAFALVVFATVISLFAQAGKIPAMQDVPTLQEWWRADNMGYGVNGMTWLDNFYNGKGALVISTPKGVQTWQLRYPWDTVNVFTWSGGDANIKAGDCNGDGIMDYVDAKGNLYQGIANGQLPKPQPIAQATQNAPWITADFNQDGRTDFINVLSAQALMEITLGKADLAQMTKSTFPLQGIDSMNRVLHGFATANKELRIICRHLRWNNISTFPYRITTSDGFRLLRIWWDNTTQTPKTEILKDVSWNVNNGDGEYWLSSILQSETNHYLIASTKINGDNSKTNLVIYDLSNDTFDKISETRMDGIAGIYGLAHSIDKDSVPDWFIKNQDGWTCNFYSGSSLPVLNLMGTAKVCHADYVCSTAPVRSPNYSSLCIGGTYFSSGDESSCWSIINLPDSVVSVSETDSDDFHLSIRVLPNPTEQSNYPMVEITSDKNRVCNLFLVDLSGKQILLQSDLQITEGVFNVTINNQYASSAGHYFLRLTDGKVSVQCPIIIK